MYEEDDPQIRSVLGRALSSSSRATRRRAVAMLARVRCQESDHWIEAALRDPDDAVRETAMAVAAWTMPPTDPGWPAREDLAFGESPDAESDVLAGFEEAVDVQWQWEYAVEVWRGDGLLIGVFLSTTCSEDDVHAKRIALGQAVLSSAAASVDRFEPSDAAAFIVGKRRVRREAGKRRELGGR